MQYGMGFPRPLPPMRISIYLLSSQLYYKWIVYWLYTFRPCLIGTVKGNIRPQISTRLIILISTLDNIFIWFIYLNKQSVNHVYNFWYTAHGAQSGSLILPNVVYQSIETKTRFLSMAGQGFSQWEKRLLSWNEKLLGHTTKGTCMHQLCHDDVIKWKHFPRYWPFVRGIHRSPVNSLHKASDAERWCFLWSAPE